MKNINCDEIRESLLNGAHLLDVRTSAEYSRGALPQSINIPLHILPVLADSHLEPDASIFIYCRSGGRAIMAEKILRNMGYENIQNIGGITQLQNCH